MSDPRQYAPSVERNRDPILAVLQRLLPAQGTVLEIASGSGQHVVHFARALPALLWQPSDADPQAVASIAAWSQAEALPNLLPVQRLDVHRQPWPLDDADALLCINMIHIAPWSATEALFAGARCLLAPGAPLLLYGPFRRGGEHTAPSNGEFDVWLKARDASFGVRDLEAVEALGQAHGFVLTSLVAMPANNFVVEFRATASV